MILSVIRGAGLRMLAGTLVLFSLSGGPSAASSETVDAFSAFIKSGNYENANFYLENKLIRPEDIDTSQLFYEVLTEKYFENMTANAGAIDKLYTYLNELVPIDLNRPARCGDATCLLASELLRGASPEAVTYFVERGLDLNARMQGLIPSTVPLLVRLGTAYSMADLNYFVSKGMVLGDELYTIEELSAYRDRYLDYGQLAMPGNYLTLADQNFLDVLVILLGTQIQANYPEESVHRKTLCDFIAYAAPSFSPSFDYLLYVLENVKEFRGSNIGKMEKYGDHIYQPFPGSCVTLLQNMAASHNKLETVISRFAGEQDVDTATWLISIRNGQNKG